MTGVAGLTPDSKGDPTGDTSSQQLRERERERERFIRHNLHNGVVSATKTRTS